jgi:hypothetical protein
MVHNTTITNWFQPTPHIDREERGHLRREEVEGLVATAIADIQHRRLCGRSANQSKSASRAARTDVPTVKYIES